MKQVLTVSGSPEHWRPGDSDAYVDAMRAAGMEPVVVSPELRPEVRPEVRSWGQGAPARALLEPVAGLLLMGGDDVNPALYGEEPGPDAEAPDSPRDQLECALIHEALQRDMPLLAICRGMQILNVHLGGSLVQHLAASGRHRRQTPDRSLPAHAIEIVPETLLARIAGGSLNWNVNSRHHQAIARLGAGLRVSARDAEDETIEAVERPDRRFCIGVQWHPENQSPVDSRHAALFRAFGAALELR